MYFRLSIKPAQIFTFCLALTALSAFTAGIACAQQFGGNPPTIKWQQINTPAAKVIFPTGMDSTAKRVANIIQQVNAATRSTLGNKQRQVSIVLQNQTTQTNGYVGLAPFRSEFYLTPQQNSLELGGIAWPDLLSVHEYRHVQQYNNFNVGLSKVLRTIFGEGGQALGNALSVPDWFFEGDAVYNETLVSSQGRGRLPWFHKDYRAMWAAGKNYSWMKLRNGSYVDFVPSHYPLGYMLAAYGRETYGDDFWRQVTLDAAAYRYGALPPIQKAIQRHSGKSYGQFREDALDYFKKQFNDNAPALAKNPKQHFVADQEFPAFIGEDTLVYVKFAYNQVPVFIIKANGYERKLSTRALANDRHFTYRNGKIAYAGYRADERWGFRNYSEIRILDINTSKEQAITRRTKYFSPDISADGKTIATVNVEPSGKRSLHIIDATNGSLLAALPNPQNLFYTYPKFYGNSYLLSAVRNPAGKMAITQIDIKSGRHEYLTSFTDHPLGYITVQGDTVYFTATEGKDDKLFALSLKDRKLFKIDHPAMESGIGVYQPAISASKIAWVSFTAYGNQIQQVDKSAIWSTEISPDIFNTPLPDYHINSLAASRAANLLSNISDSVFTVLPYSKGYNLFNFHSLIPEISDPNYKFSLRGENVLNTFRSDVFFNYNRNEGYKQLGFDATYGALFPYLSVGADYIFDRRVYSLRNQENVYWNEVNLHGGVQLPLNFTRGKKITGFNFGSDIYFSRNMYRGAYAVNNRNLIYLNNFATFSTRTQQAMQHIYPRWGQSIALNYKSGLNVSANQWLASGTFYFPGISTNDNLIMTAAYQQRGKNDAVGFSNNFPFSRGYTAENLHQLYKVGANYHFPIAYPDAGIGNTAYLLRVRGNAFYEHTRGHDFYANESKFSQNFNSAGLAVFFDTKFFNQQSLSFGIRYSRLLNDDYFGGKGRNRVELVLPVSIF
ncbi:hypothetical protein DJ568_04295 [Mucilaginibacter hurinus]|uniref:Bacterial surface antigen (D15) domain-containing protein n=1 Tax=Mucilaginibacter hurinus TaxID=2201324 RepID=A0A367GS79_9SPHI|nr:hypothetical protein [Mucilaginibacter hurinus]RCH55978.1 hypothetical protein DJ568_04295 [Mucilaginibacter hurinus]